MFLCSSSSSSSVSGWISSLEKKPPRRIKAALTPFPRSSLHRVTIWSSCSHMSNIHLHFSDEINDLESIYSSTTVGYVCLHSSQSVICRMFRQFIESGTPTRANNTSVRQSETGLLMLCRRDNKSPAALKSIQNLLETSEHHGDQMPWDALREVNRENTSCNGRILLLLKVCLVSSHQAVVSLQTDGFSSSVQPEFKTPRKTAAEAKKKLNLFAREWTDTSNEWWTSARMTKETKLTVTQPLRQRWASERKRDRPPKTDIPTCWATFRPLWERYRSVLFDCIHDFNLKVTQMFILDRRVIFRHIDINKRFRNYSADWRVVLRKDTETCSFTDVQIK